MAIAAIGQALTPRRARALDDAAIIAMTGILAGCGLIYEYLLANTAARMLGAVESVIFAMILGVTLGLIAGYLGGTVDAVIMRIADVQISFPAILIALLIDGVMRAVISGERHEETVIYVLVLAIGLSRDIVTVRYRRTLGVPLALGVAVAGVLLALDASGAGAWLPWMARPFAVAALFALGVLAIEARTLVSELRYLRVQLASGG